MALKKTFITSTDIEIKDSYLRVEHVLIQEKTNLAFRVRAYANSEAKLPVEEVTLSCAYFIDGENPIAQAYAHLKTLPEFEGAVDC